MLALTFGSDADRARALEDIQAIHRRVRGRLPQAAGPFTAGAPYSAEDPELVLWVHGTLLDSFPLAYERFVAPLSGDDRDRYCIEAAEVAAALGARQADVPRTWAHARLYLDSMYASGRIVVTPQARELAGAVLAPALARLAPPLAWGHRLVTIGLLPEPLRRQYGFSWSGRRQRAFEAAVRAIRVVGRALPDRLALWPEARPPSPPPTGR
jgi:uncharacterized protein (DUF2236 family)